METESTDASASDGSGRYPAGTGFALGWLVGVLFGVAAWVLTGEFVTAYVVGIGAGTGLGIGAEQQLDTHPLTGRQRRLLLLFAVLGGVAFVAVLLLR